MAFIHFIFADVFDDTIPGWESQLEQWTDVIEIFVKLNKLMTSCVYFMDKMMEEFQDLANSFFHKWETLCGMAGVTNYIHLLGSRHLMEFFYRYRNLYKYPQQDWEDKKG